MATHTAGASGDRTKKGLHERFACFFEDPRRERLRDLLRETGGEYAHLDFKREWPSHASLARHVLGFANSGGGSVVVGIDDESKEPTGVAEYHDKSDLTKGMQKYLPRRLLELVEIHDFRFEESEYPKLVGKAFQVLMTEDAPEHLPFLALKDGDGIKANTVYVRRGASTEEASDEELQSIVNRRIETGHSSQPELNLEAHLAHLKVLFGQISRGTRVPSNFFATMNSLVQGMGLDRWEYQPNPDYPKEHLDAFIRRMIASKKRRIEIELDVLGLDEAGPPGHPDRG